MASDHHLNGGG